VELENFVNENFKHMKHYNSPAEALDDLKKRGYEADFETQSDCLYCSVLDLRLYEEEFHVDEVYHFEGDSDPAANATVYAFTSPGGLKGTAVDGIGTQDSSQ
jgi:hypothetical protein